MLLMLQWLRLPQRGSSPNRRFQPRMEELEPRRLLTLLPAPTTNRIGVIEDELAFFSKSPETVFAATHADGTQKLPSYLNQLYASVNPNWYLLHYQLGSELSLYDYIINNTWAQDLDPNLPNFYVNPTAGPGGVTSHEDWFEHSNGSLDPSSAGKRLAAPDGSLLANLDSPGWRQYEATTLVQNMLASGSQGVFADSFAGPTFGYYVNQGDTRYDYGGPIPGPADPGLWPGGRTWLTQAADYISYIQGKLTAVGEALYGPGNGFAYVPNAGPMNTGWADVDYSAAKGLFAEGFADVFGQITDADWTMSMNRALRVTSTSNPANSDRMFIMQSYLSSAPPDSPQGLQERSWVLGSYLLLKGDHTYVNMFGAPVDTRLEWYPEYQVNLGAAQDPGGMPSTVDGYYDAGSGLYVRHFENGLVLLNNSGASLVYNPGQAMQQVIVQGWGGGVRPGDIDPATNRYVAGSLASQLTSSVTVGPYSSVILINPGQPLEGPPPPAPPAKGAGDGSGAPLFSILPLSTSTVLTAPQSGTVSAASSFQSLPLSLGTATTAIAMPNSTPTRGLALAAPTPERADSALDGPTPLDRAIDDLVLILQ